MKRIVVFALVLNAALLGGGLLIGASLSAQEAVFSTGFEAGEGYIGVATAGPASLLVAQQDWATQFGDDNFHVYTYDGNQIPWRPLGGSPAPNIAPVNPRGGSQFVALGNGGRDMHAADFTKIVEMSADYIAGPEFDNSGGNYNGALTARPDNVAGFYSARASTATRGVDPSTDPWAPWFRVWDATDTQITTDELIAYRFDGEEGFDNLSREHWYRIGVVIDTSSGIVTQLKSQELIPGGRIWIIDDPEGPLGETLYIDGGAANTSPLQRVGIYNVGNGTVSCFDNVYVGPPYEWQPVPARTTEICDNGVDDDGDGGADCDDDDCADAESCQPQGNSFTRGDANTDGNVDISDPTTTLQYLFLGGAELRCVDAADTDDDGMLSLTDAIYVLNHLFLGTTAPPAPYPGCGRDETVDGFECETSPANCE